MTGSENEGEDKRDCGEGKSCDDSINGEFS